jgi:hypothetical protein
MSKYQSEVNMSSLLFLSMSKFKREVRHVYIINQDQIPHALTINKFNSRYSTVHTYIV